MTPRPIFHDSDGRGKYGSPGYNGAMFTANDVLLIADGWASPDDWGMPSIYPSVLRKVLADAERVGATVRETIAHAKHLRSKCVEVDCPWRVFYNEKD